MAETPLYMQAHFREQVKDAFDMAIQQKVSKFKDIGMVDPDWVADQMTWREMGLVTFQETTGERGGDTQQGEFEAGFRSGFKRYFEAAIILDKNDKQKLGRANLPTSEIQQQLVMAWNRQIDQVFVEAAQAQSLGGPHPYITPQTLPAHMTVPVDFQKLSGSSGSNTNLTIFKIQESLTRMEVSDVDLDGETVYIVISPQQKQNWIVYAQSALNDTFAKMVNEWRMNPSGGLLGCKVITSNKLVKYASGFTRSLVFTQRAFASSPMHFDIKIDELPTKRHAIQIAAYADLGITRRWDELTKLINCDDAGLMLN